MKLEETLYGDDNYKYSEVYQRLVGRLVLDKEFREAVLGDDETARSSALSMLDVKEGAEHDEIATYLRFRKNEIKDLLDQVDQDVSFMA